MAGAMAGTAVLHFSAPTSELRVVTLTINNSCNLRCPHCYLQYDGESELIQRDSALELTRQPYEHLAIVGKEPLLNRGSAQLCAEIIAAGRVAGKTISLITNGFGLPFLEESALIQLQWIDISLDGGPESYGLYRKGSYSRIIKNLLDTRSRCTTPINALHVLSDGTINCVDDMMAAGDDFSFEQIVFSPYQETNNHGLNSVSTLALKRLIAALGGSESFMEDPRSLLLLGRGSFVEQGYPDEAVLEALAKANLLQKTKLLRYDPLMLGFVRVTYDGFVLSPEASLHPAHYGLLSKKLLGRSLPEVYREFRLAA